MTPIFQRDKEEIQSINISINIADNTYERFLYQESIDINRGSGERREYICPYTEEELEMARWIVQQEVMDGSLKHKIIITQILVNRLNNGYWGVTLKDVMLFDGQFPSKVNWFEEINPPDENTNQAIQEVLIENSCEDISQGALYFYAPKRVNNQSTVNWFEGLEFLFEFEGHRFFK
jgi:hypothetical protein